VISIFPRQSRIVSALIAVVLVFFLASAAPAETPGQLAVTPSSATFGNVSVGSSRTVSEVLSNTGGSRITLTKVVSSGAAFQLRGCALPLMIYRGKSASCSLVFTPTVTGPATGSVTFYWRVWSGYRTPVTVAVSGTGVSTSSAGTLSGTPSSLSFGTVQTGSSGTLSETLANSGSAAVTISQVSISGSGFSFSGITPPVTLSAGQSVRFSVAFAPQSNTTTQGSLSVLSNASNPTLSIGLSGSGSSPGQLSVSPASTSFGNVIVGMQQKQTGTVTAVGGPVTVSSIGLNGSGLSVSGISLPLSMSAGQSTPFTLTFAPQAVGTVTGSVTFLTNGSTSATETVSGSGIAAPQHSVTLNWSPSSSSNVLGYYVYRGSQSGGPYSIITSAAHANTNYVDSSVRGGQTYYYVVTAVDSAGVQSSYSNQVQAVIPYP
jgi:hypothetical protein